jgi:uncharacterized iron-regulated protein
VLECLFVNDYHLSLLLLMLLLQKRFSSGILRMRISKCLLVSALLLGSACAPFSSMPEKNEAVLQTSYDYQLLDAGFAPVDLEAVADKLQKADVVFVGEYHRNQASHLLEMQLFAALHRRHRQSGREMVLSMEMFSRDQQAIVNRYLGSEIGERYLMEEAPTWKNYQGNYRPLVEYAKRNGMPVVAANAAGDIVRCVGRQGAAYIETLDAAQAATIAQAPFAPIAAYEKKFFSFMSGADHSPSERQRQSYLAQLTRDNTMAESINRAILANPGSQVLHINGAFHSDNHLGTAGALKRINPSLIIAVVSPVHVGELDTVKQQERTDDFYYLLQPQPAEFVDDDYKKKKRAELFARAREKAGACQ